MGRCFSSAEVALSTLKVLLMIAALGWCSMGEVHSASVAEAKGDGCPECDDEFCPKSEEECKHGRIADRCRCCPEGVCALGEREKCLNAENGEGMIESGMRKYGSCGEYMICTARTDLLRNDRSESLCICREAGPVCGSDNVTYGSMCETESLKIQLIHNGPCVTSPVIVSPPEAGNTYEGGNFALNCEAKGFPVPVITWEFRSLAGSAISLPGDDPTIVVHSRGGPEMYTLTSWLQIEALRKNDSGTYTCVAESSEGEDRSSTSVQVTVYSE